MGAAGRMETAAVKQPELEALLADDPTGFGFFQAVRLLERLRPGLAPVGGFNDAGREVARFTAHPSLAFPASEIQALELRPEGAARMAVNFMGLTGATGVLPYHYTQIMIERLRSRDRALRDFLDLFHHRIISLFYRAWEKHHFAVAYERDHGDRLTAHVADLLGLRMTGTDDSAEGVPSETMLYYAGLLGPQQRSGVALQEMVQDYFGVAAEIEQFVGGWFPLAGSTQCQLDDEGTGASSQLGQGAVVGDEVWDQQSRVRIRLGPLSRSQYDRFLPGGEAHQPLRHLVRQFGGDNFDFEVQLILARDEVPALVLGGDAPVTLGWATWIRTAPREDDAADTTFTL